MEAVPTERRTYQRKKPKKNIGSLQLVIKDTDTQKQNDENVANFATTCSDVAADRGLKRKIQATEVTKSSKVRRTLEFSEVIKDNGELETCVKCGMVYSHSRRGRKVPSASMHARYCSDVQIKSKAIPFPGWRNERVVARFPLDGGRVVMLVRGDPNYASKKATDIRALMDRDVGWNDTGNKHRNETMYIYVTANNKVAGCLVAESIKEAFPIIVENTGKVGPIRPIQETEEEVDTLLLTSVSPPTTPAKNRDINAAGDKYSPSTPGGGGMVYCSTTPQPAKMGVSRIWVHPRHRRQSIATRLVDAARVSFIFGEVLEKSECALTQPTCEGKAFGTQYFGTKSFLVYH